MKTYTAAELKTIVELHGKWLRCEEGGVRADLSYADLRYANLSSANLRSANLSYADLRYANLSYADLRSANLSYADLRSADLRYADLRYADLRSADLSYADLRSADLRYADLRSANLSYANLRSANLSYADLRYADLQAIKEDVIAVVSAAPDEALYLLNAIRAGKVDGSSYEGECACLVGTIANGRGCRYDALVSIKPNYARPAEKFFTGIRKGDTPANNPVSAIAAEWVEEWLTINRPDVPSVSGTKVKVMIEGKEFTATVD